MLLAIGDVVRVRSDKSLGTVAASPPTAPATWSTSS